MRLHLLFLGANLLKAGHANPLYNTEASREAISQQPVIKETSSKLHGRFLHITGKFGLAGSLPHCYTTERYPDFHPDPFYKVHSSTAASDACHTGKGPAGTYGAETSDCDSPIALVNATFDWIANNLRDTVDFVIWTGDSARHDSDEKIPRTASQVLDTNTFIANRFAEVFGNGRDESDPTKDLSIPIVPTFGNNDVLPHNILLAGPNKWLKSYSNIWKKFIPEEQRHGFERGGWFYTEVIPNKLAVFSLNTLYFFDHNAGVDGCAAKSEPGYEHMEWLRIQLQFMRDRGMKAIMMGHVPPARTDSKALWDESCWQKYTLWLQQYRDVVVSGVYGHMNVDHFLIQDTEDIDLLSLRGQVSPNNIARAQMDEELDIASSADYLEELRDSWSKLPKAPSTISWPPNVEDLNGHYDDIPDDLERERKKKGKKGKKPTKKEKYLQKIGGPWGERYQLSMVNPSIVPNYFPTIRIVEYNISGLETATTWADGAKQVPSPMSWIPGTLEPIEDADEIAWVLDENFQDDPVSIDNKKKHKKHKKPKNPDLVVPQPPAKTSPPGPAYSPQTFTLLGYVQYFANLTHINNDYAKQSSEGPDDLNDKRWNKGKHHGKDPKTPALEPNPFKFEVEYSTFNDTIYRLKDMTVRSYLKLADRIGQYKAVKKHSFAADLDNLDSIVSDIDADTEEVEFYDDDENMHDTKKNKKQKKCGKQCKKQKKKNRVWLTFAKRAFVGTLEKADLKSFETLKDPKIPLVQLEEKAQKENHEVEEL